MADINDFPEIPASKVAFVVTSLEMRAPPNPIPTVDAAFDIRRVHRPCLDWYRQLFRHVGTDWLWFGRLKLEDDALARIVHDPKVEVYALSVAGRDEGLLELDFRTDGASEILYFGISVKLIGQGAGRELMSFALRTAWAQPIRRIWVHTCTGDHPGALQFYMRSGFRPFRRQIEVADDPRLSGLLPETAAPHVPIIRC